MTHSIYHFFHSLVQDKNYFKKVKKLAQFPFNKKLLSCRNSGIFPDLAIQVNRDKKIFSGGELIELKDSDERDIRNKLNLVFTKKEFKDLMIFRIKHHFNGYFLVAQVSL